MSQDNEERRLAEAYSAVRRDTEARTPDFEAMLARAKSDAAGLPKLGVIEGGGDGVAEATQDRRHTISRFGGWVSLAVAAAASGLLLVDRASVDGTSDPADAEFEALVAAYSAQGSWTSPTAALLNIPGVDLGSVPTFGDVLEGANPSDAESGRQS